MPADARAVFLIGSLGVTHFVEFRLNEKKRRKKKMIVATIDNAHFNGLKVSTVDARRLPPNQTA